MKLKNLVIPLIAISLILSSCQSPTLKRFFPEQTWSENYTQIEGSICSSPELIDGDLDTIGGATRITLNFPKRVAIHRILIRDTNIEDFFLYVKSGSGDRDWKKIRKIKDNTKSTIDLRLTAFTDGIRLIINGTSDDKRIGKEVNQVFAATDNLSRRRAGLKRARPIAAEIELYGLVKVESPPPKVDDQLF